MVVDQSKMSFAERIKLKTNSGFDNQIRERLPELREKAIEKKASASAV